MSVPERANLIQLGSEEAGELFIALLTSGLNSVPGACVKRRADTRGRKWPRYPRAASKLHLIRGV